MKHSDQQIVEYARSQVRFVDQQRGKRLVLGMMGTVAIVAVIVVIQMIREKSDKLGAALWQDEKFLAGMAMGILLVVGVGISALAVVRMFAGFYGREIEVYRLLVRLTEGKGACADAADDDVAL